MKKAIFLLLTVVAASILIGCSNPGLQGEAADNDSTGTIQLSWQNAGSRGLSGRNAVATGNNIQDAKKVLLSIQAADGTALYTNKELKVYNFNGSFLSESLTLKVGSYKLTDYTVLNEAGTVIFAAPKEGSNQAQFASDPLPINFTVTKNQTTEVVPEVIDITGITPADLGYSSFSFKEIKLLNFAVTVMVKDASTDKFVPTEAVLDVTSDTRAYHYNLAAGPNTVSVNDNYSSYTLTVTKPGYEDHRVTYTNAELKGFQQKPLVINPVKKLPPVNKTIDFSLSVETSGSGPAPLPWRETYLEVTTATIVYNFPLNRGMNMITVDDDSSVYNLKIVKPGCEEYLVSYTNAELKSFKQNPLYIMLNQKMIEFNISVRTYDASSDSYIFTDAMLDVMVDNYVLTSIHLPNSGTIISLPDGGNTYTLTFKKNSIEYRKSYTNAELKSFVTNPPVITLVEKPPVKTFDFKISVMVKDASSDLLTLTDATLVVTANFNDYRFPLSATTNSVTIDDLDARYELTIFKTDYESYIASYTNAELKGFLNSPLNITLLRETVTFADPNLEAAVRDVIKKPTGDIYPADVNSLTILNADNRKISNLSGIENLSSLKRLYLSGNMISDLAPLRSLYNITELKLNSNKISDLSSLVFMRELTDLYLINNSVSDIFPLSQMMMLKNVRLSGNILDAKATGTYIPAMRSRGVLVTY